MRILLVEDDESVGSGIQRGLSRDAGMTVDWLKEGYSALNAIRAEHFDVILLDLNLPGKSGFEVLQGVRQNGVDTPVIILTARDAIEDRVKGLDSGADDYMIKPCDINELTARVRALQRRATNRTESTISCQNVTLDPASRSVTVDNVEVVLSRREFTLLHKLMERVGQVVSREKLNQALYGWGEDIDSNTLEVHIHNLRKKLNTSAIRTIRGVGYMFEKDKPQQTS